MPAQPPPMMATLTGGSSCAAGDVRLAFLTFFAIRRLSKGEPKIDGDCVDDGADGVIHSHDRCQWRVLEERARDVDRRIAENHLIEGDIEGQLVRQLECGPEAD